VIATPIYDQMIAEREGRPPGGLAEEDFSALSLPPAIELPEQEVPEEIPEVTESSNLTPAEVARVVLKEAPQAPEDDDPDPESCLDSELCTKADPCPRCGPEKYEPDPEETQEMEAPQKAVRPPRKAAEKKIPAPSVARARSRTRTGSPAKNSAT
jgi:hypothetical protein